MTMPWDPGAELGTPDRLCPRISVVSKATCKSRLRALEGRLVSSKNRFKCPGLRLRNFWEEKSVEGSLICPPGKAVISNLPNISLLETSLFLLVTFSFALRNQKGTIESLFQFLQRLGFVAVLVWPCHVHFDQRVSWQGSISFWMCLQLRNCDRSGYSSFHSWGYKQWSNVYLYTRSTMGGTKNSAAQL